MANGYQFGLWFPLFDDCFAGLKLGIHLRQRICHSNIVLPWVIPQGEIRKNFYNIISCGLTTVYATVVIPVNGLTNTIGYKPFPFVKFTKFATPWDTTACTVGLTPNTPPHADFGVLSTASS